MIPDRRWIVECYLPDGWEVYRANMTRDEAFEVFNRLVNQDPFGVRLTLEARYAS